MIDVYFSLFTIFAVLCALGVWFARHPITGAINLVGVMLALAGIYSVLASPFLAIVQILVYAGAIMMLVVFVIMVLNGARDRSPPRGVGKLGAISFVLVVAVVAIFGALLIDAGGRADGVRPLDAAESVAPVQVQAIGASLFDFSPESRGWYILFEVIGLVLLTAMTGAVLLAKRSLRSTEHVAPVAAEGGH